MLYLAGRRQGLKRFTLRLPRILTAQAPGLTC